MLHVNSWIFRNRVTEFTPAPSIRIAHVSPMFPPLEGAASIC